MFFLEKKAVQAVRWRIPKAMLFFMAEYRIRIPCLAVNRPQEQTPTPVFFALVFFALIEEPEKRRYETNLLIVFVMFSSLLGIMVVAVDAVTFAPGSVGGCLVWPDSGRLQASRR